MGQGHLELIENDLRLMEESVIEKFRWLAPNEKKASSHVQFPGSCTTAVVKAQKHREMLTSLLRSISKSASLPALPFTAAKEIDDESCDDKCDTKIKPMKAWTKRRRNSQSKTLPKYDPLLDYPGGLSKF